MSVNLIRPFAAAVLGASLMPSLTCAQEGGETLAPMAEHPAVGATQHAPVAPRSGLWQTVNAERRRPSEDADSYRQHRLSEMQRQELREQIRRAALPTDNPHMAPVVSRP